MLPALKKLDIFLKCYAIHCLQKDAFRFLSVAMTLSFLTGVLFLKTEPIAAVIMVLSLLNMCYNIMKIAKQLNEEKEIYDWSREITKKAIDGKRKEIEEELEKQEEIKEDIAKYNAKHTFKD